MAGVSNEPSLVSIARGAVSAAGARPIPSSSRSVSATGLTARSGSVRSDMAPPGASDTVEADSSRDALAYLNFWKDNATLTDIPTPQLQPSDLLTALSGAMILPAGGSLTGIGIFNPSLPDASEIAAAAVRSLPLEVTASAAWQAQRNQLLDLLRDDYIRALAAAQADPSASAAGWLSNAAIDYDSAQPLIFAPQAFQQNYVATDPAGILHALALHLSRESVGAMLAHDPHLFEYTLLADRPSYAAGAAPGQAMLDANTLGLLDLTLNDPVFTRLIADYGGTAPATDASQVNWIQATLYGPNRFALMGRLHNGIAAVRYEFEQALAQAQSRELSGPFWVDGASQQLIPGSDGNGYVDQWVTVATHEFDPQAFSNWYAAQAGTLHEAFALLFGPASMSPTGGDAPLTYTQGLSPGWQLIAGRLVSADLVPLNLANPPDLHDGNAIRFDPGLGGWVTARGNIDEAPDYFERLVVGSLITIAGVVSYGAALELFAGTALEGTVLAAASAAAAASATTTAVGAGINGGFSWSDVIKAALRGALSAGLGAQLNSAFNSLGPAGDYLGSALTQAAVAKLFHGDASAAAFTAVVNQFAVDIGQDINAQIDRFVGSQAISPDQAAALRQVARMLQTAIRIAARPGDPMLNFAQQFIDTTLGESYQTWREIGRAHV